jgi:hypothetical protein
MLLLFGTHSEWVSADSRSFVLAAKSGICLNGTLVLVGVSPSPVGPVLVLLHLLCFLLLVVGKVNVPLETPELGYAEAGTIAVVDLERLVGMSATLAQSWLHTLEDAG